MPDEHIFISYSHTDTDYAHDLCRELEKYGFDIWIDERIDYGDTWQQVIEEQIDTCTVFLVVLTDAARKSEWVPKEITYANNAKKRITAIWLEGKSLPLTLVDKHIEDLRDKPKGTLPGLNFYQRLAGLAHRKSVRPLEELEKNVAKYIHDLQVIDEVRRATPEVKLQPVEQNEAAFDEIRQWDKYRRPGNNDYYGMTMLSLALENAGSYPQHAEAITHLRRAFKLEPRIIDKGWMNEIHKWNEEQHQLLERIIKDHKFWT